MGSAAGEFAKGVGDRTEEGRNWTGNAKKMLFRRNEPKVILKPKELAFSGAKNELLFECRKPQSKPRNGHKSTLSKRHTPGATAGRPYREMNRRMDRGSKRDRHAAVEVWLCRPDSRLLLFASTARGVFFCRLRAHSVTSLTCVSLPHTWRKW